MPGSERKQPERSPSEHDCAVEIDLRLAEERAKERLWRLANIGLTAENFIKIEQAWANQEDDKILSVINDWGWDRDPLLDELFLDLARENEDRGWTLYRSWLRGKHAQDPDLIVEKARHARERIRVYEQLSQDAKKNKIVSLKRMQWQITIEEGQAVHNGKS